MLSKSAARLFFLSGTGLFSLVFLGLTVDTIRQVPSRSHEENLTPEVALGQEIWTENNCMGCHTILGEGAYYAPELTKVYERRGPEWMKVFLKDPEAMFPGQRRMVKYDFTDSEIDALVAYFKWIGEIDTNGFPAKPDLVPAAQAASLPKSAQASASPAIYSQICQSCHALGGQGGAVGPALDGVGSRWKAEDLERWLKDPQAYKPGTAMPNLNLPDATRAELVQWLSNLK